MHENDRNRILVKIIKNLWGHFDVYGLRIRYESFMYSFHSEEEAFDSFRVLSIEIKIVFMEDYKGKDFSDRIPEDLLWLPDIERENARKMLKIDYLYWVHYIGDEKGTLIPENLEQLESLMVEFGGLLTRFSSIKRKAESSSGIVAIENGYGHKATISKPLASAYVEKYTPFIQRNYPYLLGES